MLQANDWRQAAHIKELGARIAALSEAYALADGEFKSHLHDALNNAAGEIVSLTNGDRYFSSGEIETKRQAEKPRRARKPKPTPVLEIKAEAAEVIVSTPDDAALDALAAALAPRLLREVRALLAAEADDDRALGVAALAELGYEPGPSPSPSSGPVPPAPGVRSRRRTSPKPKRS
ncbi:MAG: hypothetical protein WDO74_17040 [Pseudomonadota bacterium]